MVTVINLWLLCLAIFLHLLDIAPEIDFGES